MAAVAHSDAPEMDDLKPGTALLRGQYEIESFLSSGGFAITYLARDSLARRVVIKECFPNALCRRAGNVVAARSRTHQAEFRSIVKLFVREAWALSKLTHPNIVGVHQVFEDNDTAYMALDYIDGFDLLQTLEDDSLRLSPQQINDLMRQILSAVGFVHDQDMLHRDISPDNILIDRKTGKPVLIDFGAAREEVSKVNRVLSELRVVKDGYSPQEFYVNGSNQGPSSDLYALAATFYHLIRGETPPVSQARLFAIASQQPDPYVPLDGAIEGYDRPFLEAINQAMNVLPKDRIQSARDWERMISADADMGSPVAPEEAVASLVAVAVAEAQAPQADAEPTELPGAAQGAPVAAPRKSMLPLLLAAVASVALVGGLVLTFGGPLEEKAGAPAVQAAQSATVRTPGLDPFVAARPDAAPPAVTAETTEVAASPAAEPGAPAPAAGLAASGSPQAAAAQMLPEAGAAAVTGESADAPVAPAIEPETPAPAADVAASDTPESAPPDDKQAEAIASPEGVQPIAPTAGEGGEAVASATASTEDAVDPGPENAAADQAGALSVAAAEPEVAEGATPLGTELAMSVVTEAHGLRLPFFHDGSARTVIAGVSSGAEDWMAAGQRIVEVNGAPIRAFEDIAGRLRAEVDAAVAANEGAVAVTLGVEAFPGAEIIRKPVTLSIVPEITVANGATFQIVPTETGPRPMVSALPWNVETELRVGDIVQLYLAHGGQVETGAEFREILLREIALGARLLNFAASRNGEVWLASLKVELES